MTLEEVISEMRSAGCSERAIAAVCETHAAARDYRTKRIAWNILDGHPPKSGQENALCDAAERLDRLVGL